MHCKVNCKVRAGSPLFRQVLVRRLACFGIGVFGASEKTRPAFLSDLLNGGIIID